MSGVLGGRLGGAAVERICSLRENQTTRNQTQYREEREANHLVMYNVIRKTIFSKQPKKNNAAHVHVCL